MSDLIRCPRCDHAAGNIVDYDTRQTLSCQYCEYPKPPLLSAEAVRDRYIIPASHDLRHRAIETMTNCGLRRDEANRIFDEAITDTPL